MALTPSQRQIREWPLLLLTVAVVGAVCLPLWQTLADDRSDGDPRLASIILSAWTSVLGFLSAEIFGSLTELISDTGALYQAHLHAVMLGMGFQPELAEQAVTSQT